MRPLITQDIWQNAGFLGERTIIGWVSATLPIDILAA